MVPCAGEAPVSVPNARNLTDGILRCRYRNPNTGAREGKGLSRQIARNTVGFTAALACDLARDYATRVNPPPAGQPASRWTMRTSAS